MFLIQYFFPVCMQINNLDGRIVGQKYSTLKLYSIIAIVKFIYTIRSNVQSVLNSTETYICVFY